jgi:hypothetical protein
MIIAFAFFNNSIHTTNEMNFNVQLLAHMAKVHSVVVVGEVKFEVVQFLKTKLNLQVQSQDKLRLKECDVLITQDGATLRQIEKHAKVACIPIVFINHSSRWRHQPFVCSNLTSVVSLSSQKQSINVPIEIIQSIKAPIYAKTHTSELDRENTHFSDSYKHQAIHYYQNSDRDLRIIKTLISVFNVRTDYGLTIVAPRAINRIIRMLCNSNISLKDKRQFNANQLTRFDVAIASDGEAVQSMISGVATIILGKRGLSGLVTSQNIQEHLKFHLSGRIGGELDEMIPLALVHEELNTVAQEKQHITKEMQSVGQTVKNAYNSEQIFTFLEAEITKAILLYRKLFFENDTSLLPCKSRNITSVSSNNGEALLVSDMGQILGKITSRENIILGKCNGKTSIEQIATETATPIQELAQFIRLIWEDKIIFFEYHE